MLETAIQERENGTTFPPHSVGKASHKACLCCKGHGSRDGNNWDSFGNSSTHNKLQCVEWCPPSTNSCVPRTSEYDRIWNKGLWRKSQPTPAFLPGESHGRRSLIGYNPWGCKELDMTKRLHFHFPVWESTCQSRRHKRRKFKPWVRKIPWRRRWTPTLILLPGKSHGQRCLVGCAVHRAAESQTGLSN